ncbi:MAG TPA: hypothetical protein VHG91_09215 [Longimicrobium sp.]|nr:hypothetical protein [Longimicrobium sp.]
MPRRIRLRALAQNWRLKLAALALAVLLWAVVSAEQVTTQWIPVRVEPVVRDPAYVLTGGPEPAEVRVRFTGPGRELWELALDRPVLVLPVRDVGAARSFVLDPAMVRVPEGLRVSPQDVRPAVVRLELERVVTREVPVRARVAARSLERYVVGDSLRVAPATVRATGPENVLDTLSALFTRPFEIVPDDDTSFTRRAEVDTAGLGGVTLSAGDVRVSGGVDRRVERAFAVVPVSPPPGLAATPAQVELRVRGPERSVRAILPIGVRATVPSDSLPVPVPPGGVEAPVVVTGVPAGAEVRTVPARVRVAPAPAPPAESLRAAPPR